jgi:hypothetical protein
MPAPSREGVQLNFATRPTALGFEAIALPPRACKLRRMTVQARELPESAWQARYILGVLRLALTPYVVRARSGWTEFKGVACRQSMHRFGHSAPEGKYAARFRNFGRRKFKVAK